MSKKVSSKILFIINPNAGDRKAKKLIRKLNKYPEKVDIRLTEYPGHNEEIVLAELGNYDVFVAVGGDGTVNETASILENTKKILAVYPGGSGNGFAREFGFNKNVKDLLSSIATGKAIKADVIYINGKPSVHFVGVGYDSIVAYDFSKRKGRGFWNYVASTIKIILKYKPIQATIKLKDETVSGRFFMINIANNRQFGYHAMIAPKANPTDGKIDLVLVSSFPIFLFPIFSLKLFAGWLKTSKYVRYISINDSAIIETNEKLFHIDGEPMEIESPVKIEIKAGRLNVVDTGKVKFI